ncbi:MAG: BatD family protein [Saprospiraceae bacterium]
MSRLSIHFSLLLFTISFLGNNQPLIAQNNTAFTAKLSKQQLEVNEQFEIRFELQNGKADGFKAPDFQQFQLLSGPNRSQQTTIINGDFSSSSSYSYILAPTKAGILTIGSAMIKSEGKIYRTAPVQIKVSSTNAAIQAESTSTKVSGNAILLAKPSIRQAWIGQEITLDYKLYLRQNAGNLSLQKDPEFKGFYARQMHDINQEGRNEILNGQEYYVQTIKRVLLYPQQSGKLSIGSLGIQLQIERQSEDPFEQGFFKRYGPPITIQSAPIEIDVKALPQPAPKDFSGIIGNYAFQWVAPNRIITTDDAFNVNLTADGLGDPKLLQAPNISLPADWEPFDPKILEQAASGENGYVNNHAVFQYVFIPKQIGKQVLQMGFSYFNPEEGKYKSATTSLNVEIQKGNGHPSVQVNPQINKAPLVENDPEYNNVNWLTWLKYSFLALIVIGLFAWNRKKKSKTYAATKVQTAKRSANLPMQAREILPPIAVEIHPQTIEIDHKVALQMQLNDLQAQFQSGDAAGYFADLSQWLRSFVEYRFGVISTWTSSSLMQHLNATEVPQADREIILHLYRICESYLYGGLMPSESQETLQQLATSLLQDAEPDLQSQ